MTFYVDSNKTFSHSSFLTTSLSGVAVHVDVARTAKVHACKL